MESIFYVLAFFVAILLLVLFGSALIGTKTTSEISDESLDNFGIELGKFYKYKNAYVFVPIEVDSMGLRYFMSFDKLKGGNTYHTTKLEEFKDNLTEITYTDIFGLCG